MNERERFERLLARRPHPHVGFFHRPHLSRRQLFRNVAAGVGGYYLLDRLDPGETVHAADPGTKGTAKNCIFIFLQGAPSHVDMFDFKEMAGITPADFAPETIGGVRFPAGLMPNIARVLPKLAIVRSGLSWALAHPLAQTWMQIGRNPTSATGRIAPHIGSVVAIEKEPERRPDQHFPVFIALNSDAAPGPGYFPTQLGAFKTNPSAAGLQAATHGAGQERFERRWQLLETLDGGLRAPSSPLGAAAAGAAKLSADAHLLTFNPTVSEAFSYTPEESARYGSSSFGDACLVARKVLAADQGTRFVQITLNGWDHHSDIYSRAAANSLYVQCGRLDPAFAALIEDLESSRLLDETLVVLAGEFGRTVGPITNLNQGRDHYLQMFYVLAGGGVRPGKLVGATNDTTVGTRPPGAVTVEPGWSRNRDIRPEDIEATIYSALGINWTKVRHDDPLGRGFYYVPLSDGDAYAPVHELWG